MNSIVSFVPRVIGRPWMSTGTCLATTMYFSMGWHYR
ncbi:hypothetical protein BofuT4_uP032530.1 [Botrytis cinerea T4]|uniref:Uncharacterized protein n=1 Tax=Botryotinia fuckeliana (strain T4) TaxID=999810 RepID=G2Y8B5_BOTF4|nr:hypothetical protein BofuT4_uP032530.1 [Botrytis cinerea T4]